MLEVLSRDYIRTAAPRASRSRRDRAARAAQRAPAACSPWWGSRSAALLAGAILTETIFSWPGIGLWVYESIESRDYAIVQGATLFIAVIVVVVNLVTDLLYAVADPRIKYVMSALADALVTPALMATVEAVRRRHAAAERRPRLRGVAPARGQPGGPRRAGHRLRVLPDGGRDAARSRLRRQDRLQPGAAAQAAHAGPSVRHGHARARLLVRVLHATRRDRWGWR